MQVLPKRSWPGGQILAPTYVTISILKNVQNELWQDVIGVR